MGLSFPRLYDIPEGEAISSALLQLNPDKRIGAAEALKHPYFNPLPKKLYELPDGKTFSMGNSLILILSRKFFIFFLALPFSSESSIFTVEGIHQYPEPNRERHN